MDVSQSLQSTGRESGLTFKRPASELSRRNYRRHSPPASSHSPSPSPGGRKHARSPSAANQEDGASKRGRHVDVESEKGRGDDRSKKGADTGSRDHRTHNRDNYGRQEEHEHSYSRRYASYHDQNYHNSRPNYRHYDDGRHPRQSPERFARDRGTEECAYKRKESRIIERERFRDDRSNVRASERESKKGDQDNHEKMKGRDSERGKSGQKQRNDCSGVEAERFRHDKSSRDVHKSKMEIDKLKGKESKSERGEGKRTQVEDEYYRGREEVSDGKYQGKPAHNFGNDYPSDESEGTERSDGQDTSKKRDKDKKSPVNRQKICHTRSDLHQDACDAKKIDVTGTLIGSSSLEACKRVDEESQKGSKSCREGEGSDSSADAEAAKVAAMRAAALVNINLGAFKSLDEKKKMLWGSKDQKPAAAIGTNVWDTVQFSDRERLEKFHKLMGVKGDTVPTAGGSGDQASGLFTSQKQEELQQDLEKQFTAGLRRRDGRTVGLGL